jgi:anti-sigma factor RsiW
MRCDDMQELISPFVDGELGLLTAAEVERHLQDCTICSREYKNHRALRAALRADDLYLKPPAQLGKRVQAAVRKESRSQTNRPHFSWRWLSVAGATAVLFVQKRTGRGEEYINLVMIQGGLTVEGKRLLAEHERQPPGD